MFNCMDRAIRGVPSVFLLFSAVPGLLTIVLYIISNFILFFINVFQPSRAMYVSALSIICLLHFIVLTFPLVSLACVF